MDSLTIVFVLGTGVLLYATHQARRLGNEARDVALLGFCSGLCGVGATATALL